MWAAYYGHYNIGAFLVDSKANIEAKDNVCMILYVFINIYYIDLHIFYIRLDGLL